MNQSTLGRHFSRIGARLKLRDSPGLLSRLSFRIDVVRDRNGECFEINCGGRSSEDIQILDVQPKLRHLLLMFNQTNGKHKFLCGHDERHWFVAAVPEKTAASSVRTAFDALMPSMIRTKLGQSQVKPKNRNRRRNSVFVRQGEWFFYPSPEVSFKLEMTLKHEPLRRGSGKPHYCDELVRFGGETVYVCREYRNGITEEEYRKLIFDRPQMQNRRWRVFSRDPQVYVRGNVRHSDHKTIHLAGWHRVLMNTETQAAAMRHVAFLD